MSPARWGEARQTRLARLAGLALAVSCQVGCASPPPGMLVPNDQAGVAARVDILAATTRAPAEEPGMLFSGERGQGLSYTNVVVAVPPEREPGSLPVPTSPPGNPEREFTVATVAPLDEKGVGRWFESHAGRPRRVFVFVHGYNTRFDRAVFRFAQLAHDADADAAPVLFSWPSRGRLLDYRRDADNASYSRSDLAKLLAIAAASPKVGEITILAHSLGSWVAVEAVRQLALSGRKDIAKINNLILASPDLDVGVFRRQVEDMGPRRPHVTLFVAQNDRALWLSGVLSRGKTRLGAIDPSQDEYREQLAGLGGITVLDLTALRSNDRINHDLFAQSPAMVRLVGDRLIKGQVVTDEDVDGAWAAEALGSATGMVVSAPLLVLRAVAPD
ncbi:alpha/beta fold hydrolase [Alsobacter sp. SYSU M60028]|uniref:Alpha/beta fold hydrolase n=1 Tax=Alsobacter ponti TaxID=2962936 RepID=A0ABT1L9T1_9HYPH|nr:alpha/beta hydrolase [Alsobacter ponti]MCP8938235.1 alpha/beta fold hydrolase [Alsobacter ponti]